MQDPLNVIARNLHLYSKCSGAFCNMGSLGSIFKEGLFVAFTTPETTCVWPHGIMYEIKAPNCKIFKKYKST